MNLTGCQILEGTPNGLVLEDCTDTLISGCTVLDHRSPRLMKHAIVWRNGPMMRDGSGNLIHGCRIGTGAEGNLQLTAGIRQSENLLD